MSSEFCRLARILCFVLAFIVSDPLALGTQSASAAMSGPLLLVDAQSGEVLFERDSTMPWHPASLTKMMTAYVAFREVRAGHITYDTLIPITHRALSVETTRSGAQWGQNITLDGALKFMLVQSANDMAITIAEGVGGTVENFVILMNEASRDIGMRETHFANPNGLYAADQYTSARDLALLVQKILKEFPEQHAYFAIGGIDTAVGFRGNTNGLIGRYPGADGMKTGFICPSGFNLVSTAERQGRRLIAVVLGAESGVMRVMRSARLLDYGFADAKNSGKLLADLLPSSVITPPDLRAKVCDHDLGETAMDDMPAPSISTKLGERNFASVLPVAFGPNGKTAYAPMARNIGMPDLPLSSLPIIIATGGKTRPKGTKPIMTASINQDERDQTEVSTFGMEPLMLTGGVRVGIPGFFQ